MQDQLGSSRQFFQLVDLPTFDPAQVCTVLNGQVVCVIFRGFYSETACEKLLHRFLAHPATRQRAGDAHGSYLGSFHWRKELPEYFDDAERIAPALLETLDDAQPESWRTFVQELADLLRYDQVAVRPAEWHGRRASTPIIRSWDSGNEYSLVPHEDLAQCLDPLQSGFEIQSVPSRAVCSANLCIGNDGGGDLLLWNFKPAPEDRRALGTENTGGPYATEVVSRYDQIDVQIRPGDLYIFNGAVVHAVGPTSGWRATVSTLLGFRDAKSIVMWT